MNSIIIIIYLITISFTITQLSDMVKLIKDTWNLWKLLRILISCWKCIGFWLTLFLTQDIGLACTIFTFTYFIDLHLNTGIKI